MAGAAVTAPNCGPGLDASANAPALLAHKISAGQVHNGGHLYVQNQSAADVQLVLNDGTGDVTVILVATGGGAGQQGADWQAQKNAPFFVGYFAVYASDAGAQVAVIYN